MSLTKKCKLLPSHSPNSTVTVQFTHKAVIYNELTIFKLTERKLESCLISDNMAKDDRLRIKIH